MSAFTGYIELFHVESIFSSFYCRGETCTKDPVMHLLNFAIMHVYHKNDGQSIHLCVSKVKKTGVNIALDLSVEYYINSFYRNKMFGWKKQQRQQQRRRRQQWTTPTFFFQATKLIKAKLFRAFNTLNHVAVDQMQNLLFKFTRARDTTIFYHKILQNVVLIVNVNEYKIAAPIIFIALMPEWTILIAVWIMPLYPRDEPPSEIHN